MKKFFYLSLVLAGLFVTSCSNDDPPLADNTVNFSATELGISETESSKSFTINIDRAESTDITINIKVTATGVTYADDFTTTPAVSSNTISAIIKSGNTSTSVEIKKLAALLQGDEHIDFEISSVTGGLVPGDKKSLKLTFGAIISTGSSMTLQGGEGGSAAANSVFVDFSSNEQTVIPRTSWNLGFYNGNQFGVIMNNTLPTTAKVTDLAIDAIISDADAETLKTELTLNYTDKFAYLDDMKGDLSKSVIKEEGKVYLVNFAGLTPQLYKVKVTKKDVNTYTVQYAASNSSTVKSIDIAKNSDYNFTYVSFTDNKVVQVERRKAKWDIQWTRSIYVTSGIPYIFSDLVFINSKAGVTAATVTITDKLTYANVKSSDVKDSDYSSDIDAIGSKWRATTGSSAGVNQTQFYLIKDAAGNIYKLRFLKVGVGSDGGKRGYPELEYALVK